eukprot:jgi/Psemu1/13203/gm1.13203_g
MPSCPVHSLTHSLPLLHSTNSKGKHITSKGELTTFPNSRWRPHNRRGSVYSSDAQIDCPFHLNKQNKIDQEHIKHQNIVDGNLDSSGIKTLDKLTNFNPDLTGLRNRAISDFCPLSAITPDEFIIYHLSVTAQELRHSLNQDSFPFDIQPFSLKTNSTSRSNELRCPCPDKPGTNTLSRWLYGLGNLLVSAHTPTLDEICMGTRSTEVGSGHLLVAAHLQTLDEIGAGSTDGGLVNLSVSTHLQTLDEIRMGAGSTDVDDIHRVAKSLVGIKPLTDCTPSINQARPNLSQQVGTNLTQTSLLDPHESNLSQSTAEALLEIMGGDSGNSKPLTTIPSKPLAPNLVPHPESPLDSKNSNSDDSLPPPRFPPNPPAQIHNLPTIVPASHPFQLPASTPNLVAPDPAIKKTEMKQVLENNVIGNRPVSNQEAPNLSKAVLALFNNHKGIMTPTTLNVIVDLFNHQSIPLGHIRPHFFSHNTLCYGVVRLCYKIDYVFDMMAANHFCTENDIKLLNNFSQRLIVHVLNPDNYTTTLSLSLSIILEKFITPLSIHDLIVDHSTGKVSINKLNTHKHKNKRSRMVDNKRNSMKLPVHNRKKKVTKPEPIINTKTLLDQIPLLEDPKLMKIKELRALLFVLDICSKSTMNKFCPRGLLSDTLSQKWFSEVVHWSESNITHGKFKISDNPFYVREATLGSKLKNPSDYIDLYCKAVNSDINNHNSCALLCASGSRCYFGNRTIWSNNVKRKCYNKDCKTYYHGIIERACMDIKHQIEQDNAYAELYGLEGESSTPKIIGPGVKTGSKSDTDWESPPPSPEQGVTFYNKVDLYESKQGLAVVDKCVLWLGTSINGDCRLEIQPPKPENILMLLVFSHASESNVVIAYNSSTKTGLNCFSICYSSGGYSEELSLPQPDKSALMCCYSQCDQAGLSAILSFFNKCQEEDGKDREDREDLDLKPILFLIEKVAKKLWPMFVDIFKEGTAKNYQTLYERSCARGLQKTSWDSYETFVDDYQASDFLEPGDMPNAWLGDYTISLWCFMVSMSASQMVHIFYPTLYEYLSSDKEEYRKSINFDFIMTPKRRLYIISVNLGGSRWASKFPSEKELLLLAEFFHNDANKKNPKINQNQYLEMSFSSFPIQKDSITCGVFVCFYMCWISQQGSKLIYKLDKEHDETSVEYAKFIKILRQKYTNQLGIEGVDGKITNVLTKDYGGDNSELLAVWCKKNAKRKTEDTELKSENKISKSFKTKLSMTYSVQESKSKSPQVGVSFERPTERELTMSKTTTPEAISQETPSLETSDITTGDIRLLVEKDTNELTGSKRTSLETISLETQSPKTFDIRGDSRLWVEWWPTS